MQTPMRDHEGREGVRVSRTTSQAGAGARPPERADWAQRVAAIQHEPDPHRRRAALCTCGMGGGLKHGTRCAITLAVRDARTVEEKAAAALGTILDVVG